MRYNFWLCVAEYLSISVTCVVQASFEQLSCVEFRELLRLVTYSPLEKLDHRLTALRKQTKKWFRRLMASVHCMRDMC